MRLGLTQEQQAAFLEEAEAKLASLTHEIRWIEEHLTLKKNALRHWTKRRNRMRTLLNASRRNA